MDSRRGLASLLASTAFAGGLGYIVQLLVPMRFQDPTDYLPFSVFWATTFLFVSMLSGLQQEVTRAVRPRNVALHSEASGSARLVRAGLTVSVAIILVGSLLLPFFSGRLFDAQAWPMSIALLIALLGYVWVAILSGVYFGLQRFEYAAITTSLDALIRAALVLIPTVIGIGLVPVSYGVSLPFFVTAGLMWLFSHRSLRSQVYVDVETAKLLGNATKAILAALATGLLISGLPTLLSFTSQSLGDQKLAALILALTLTRAPLVIPILALQSFLIVKYRDTASKTLLRAFQLSALVLGSAAVVAGCAFLFGSDLFHALYGERLTLDRGELACVVLSGGATALLCLIAPALLAHNRHSAFLMTWVISAVLTIGLLVVIGDTLTGVLISVSIGPLVGSVMGGIVLVSQHDTLSKQFTGHGKER